MSTKGEKHENVILNRNCRGNCNFSGVDNLYFKGVEKKMSLAKNVGEMLKKKGATQTELAEYCCVTQTIISKILHGVKVPSVALVVRMSDFFGCTVDELVK